MEGTRPADRLIRFARDRPRQEETRARSRRALDDRLSAPAPRHDPAYVRPHRHWWHGPRDGLGARLSGLADVPWQRHPAGGETHADRILASDGGDGRRVPIPRRDLLRVQD